VTELDNCPALTVRRRLARTEFCLSGERFISGADALTVRDLSQHSVVWAIAREFRPSDSTWNRSRYFELKGLDPLPEGTDAIEDLDAGDPRRQAALDESHMDVVFYERSMTVVFGEVPDGFVQTFPPPGRAAEPLLPATRYEVEITGLIPAKATFRPR
jgi:hypothetical protein